ncbi:MAG TPA: SpoIIE family protein phosphatase [Symbiobacteriaceae bacterium]|nr:SpoIIE family protein phosphatase [Symbiobacteriaceae bacterium]
MTVLVAATPETYLYLESALAIPRGVTLVHVTSATGVLSYLGDAETSHARNPVRLVLLENGLPDLQVNDLCRQLRKNDRLKATEILVLAGSRATRDALPALLAGATEILTRPVQHAETQARIRRALAAPQGTNECQVKKQGIAEQDLALAKRVQRGVLSQPVVNADIEIDAAYIPSRALSGDMYYWTEISPGQYGILLIDVMGHGLPAALVSMAMRALMHGLVSRVVQPSLVFAELGKHILALEPHYMTALYVVVDVPNRRITYANAGHPPGLLIQAGGAIHALERTCIPLGLERNTAFVQRELTFEPPCRLIMYTDGLMEGQPVRTAIDGLKQCLVDYRDQSTLQFITSTLMVRDHLIGAPDDICLIAMTIGR